MAFVKPLLGPCGCFFVVKVRGRTWDTSSLQVVLFFWKLAFVIAQGPATDAVVGPCPPFLILELTPAAGHSKMADNRTAFLRGVGIVIAFGIGGTFGEEGLAYAGWCCHAMPTTTVFGLCVTTSGSHKGEATTPGGRVDNLLQEPKQLLGVAVSQRVVCGLGKYVQG